VNLRRARLGGGLLAAWLGLATGVVQASALFLDAGATNTDRYEIDLGSLRPHGEAWRYRVRSFTKGDYYIGAQVTDVVVDCSRRTRAELGSIHISTSRAIEGPSPSPEPRRVYEGSRQAEELDAICRVGPPEAAALAGPFPAPPDSREESAAARSTSIGVIVDAEGLVLVADRAVRHCPRVSVVASGRRRDARLLNRGPMAGLAALRMSGGPFERLLPTDGPPPVGDTVLLLGFSPGADGEARFELAPVRWSWGWPAPEKPLALNEGLVVDTSAGLIEMLILDVDATAEPPRGETVNARTIRQVLAFFGVDWPSGEKLPAAASREAMQRVGRAAVRVECLGS
jgi:hypothetical protein